MQNFLNAKPKCTHIDLMAEIEPMLGARYDFAFRTGKVLCGAHGGLLGTESRLTIVTRTLDNDFEMWMGSSFPGSWLGSKCLY